MVRSIWFVAVTLTASGAFADNGDEDPPAVPELTTAEQAKLDALRASKQVNELLLNAVLCERIDDRAEVKTKIAKEHKYARETGVVSLQWLNIYRGYLEEADGRIEEIKAAMSEQGVKTISCKNKSIANTRHCLFHAYCDKKHPEAVVYWAQEYARWSQPLDN